MEGTGVLSPAPSARCSTSVSPPRPLRLPAGPPLPPRAEPRLPPLASSPSLLPATPPLSAAAPHRSAIFAAADGLEHEDGERLAGAAGSGLPELPSSPPHHRHITHSADGRAHALLLAPPLALAAVSRAPHLPPSQLLLFLRRLRCLPEDRMRDEMPCLAMRLPLPPDDEAALAREAHDVAAAEAEAEEAARRDAELAARRTPNRDHRGGAAAAWTWRRLL
ncbi:hypothetical protein BAE44_0023681 [Dichanthelium oligosanthes]|uniref:Uncharacterized protein n=1 Tax=Dichanthelium oligosanthes TaxID=888268 RepID=A0A1E5UQY2_9POAL|nr:hypothetical protein BAE44_0023681 [Dichanthelium oligosanthes]